MRITIALAVLLGGACTGTVVGGVVPPPDGPADAIDSGSSNDPAAVARAKFDHDVAPLLSTMCAGCHASSGSYGWMAPAPDVYTAVMAWPHLVDPSAPTNSMLLTKGLHEGPAWAPEQAATVVGWISLEMMARGSTTDQPHTDAIDVVAGTNTFPLDALGAAGSSLTFTAQLLQHGLYLSNIAVSAGTGGVHVTHPLFVTWVGTTPSPDPIDSFDQVDMDVGQSMSSEVGGGLLYLENIAMDAQLSVIFKTIGPANGGGTTGLAGCKAVPSFTQNARSPLSTNCVSCHGGTDITATSAVDMTKLNDTSTTAQATACGQILGRVNLTTPSSSGVFVAPDPNSGATHPFKFATATALTAFKASVTTWIQAEQAAGP